MRVAIAGSQGLIGSSLVQALRDGGHTVRRLVRREPLAPDEFSWNPETFGLPSASLDGVDAVIGLGGVGIGDKRWSGRFKQALRDSRITPTEVLAEAVAAAGTAIFINASATGFYGDTGSEAVTETDRAGHGFLPVLVADWEAAAAENVEHRTRVVLLRTGPVLSPEGGMLAKLRPIFRLGLGGSIGSGRQYFSWITLDDAVRAILHLLDSDISGPVNLTAPQPVPFGDFVKAFGTELHRPTIFSVHGAVAKTFVGEMAEEMILASSRVMPHVLDTSGFTFEHPDITSAMRYANA